MFASEQVLLLTKKHWLLDESFDSYTWNLLQNCPGWTEEVLALANTIIERTAIAPHAFEHLVSTVGVEQPEFALRLTVARLGNQLREAIKISRSRQGDAPPDSNIAELITWQQTHSREKPLLDVIDQRDGWEGLEALANAKPPLFLQYIWPWFQDALEALRQAKQDENPRPGFPLPWTLDFRFPGEDELGLDEPPLLGALAKAVEALAQTDEPAFLEWLAKYEREDATSAQRLFANALAAEPETYAERAAQFLLDDMNRFHLGSIHDSAGTTKRLVRAVSPYWSRPTLDRFIQEVLSYRPVPPEHAKGIRRRHFSNLIRQIKLDVLSCIPEELRSDDARRFITEERRRFPEERRTRVQGGVIGSPVSAESLARGSDDDVINAFRKLPDKTDWDHPKQWMKGGNIQLSRQFAEFAKSAPERAARIIDRLEPSFGSRAAGYALDALAENSSPDLVLSLIEILDQRGFKTPEFRNSASSAIRRLIQRDVVIADPALGMLKSWLDQQEWEVQDEATEDSDEGQLARDEKKSSEKDEPKGSALWGHGGITILPQGNYPVLEVISHILLGRNDPDGLLKLYSKHLDAREDPRVWRALLRFVQFIRPADVASLSRFLLRLFKKFPELTTTHEALTMLANVHWRMPDLVRETIGPWKHSDKQPLQQAYGEMVALIALVQPELQWPQMFLEEITSSSNMVRARLGVAHAAVNIWPEARDRQPMAKLLAKLMPTADTAMWSAIFDLFRLVDEVTPEPEWVLLLEALAANIDKVRGVNSVFVVERLQTLLPHQAVLVAKLAKGLVDGWRDELGDIRTVTAGSARELVDLAITLHRLGHETRELGTALFEDLLVINAYTARETLDEIDNRFRAAPRPARRKLPRRSRRTNVRAARRA